MRPFPTLSILSILAIPALTCVSHPIWEIYFDRQIANAPDQSYAPDPGQLVGLALVFAVFATATAAAFPGMLLAWSAGCRKERWRGLRIFAWVLNGSAAAVGCWFVADFVK